MEEIKDSSSSFLNENGNTAIEIEKVKVYNSCFTCWGKTKAPYNPRTCTYHLVNIQYKNGSSKTEKILVDDIVEKYWDYLPYHLQKHFSPISLKPLKESKFSSEIIKTKKKSYRMVKFLIEKNYNNFLNDEFKNMMEKLSNIDIYKIFIESLMEGYCGADIYKSFILQALTIEQTEILDDFMKAKLLELFGIEDSCCIGETVTEEQPFFSEEKSFINYLTVGNSLVLMVGKEFKHIIAGRNAAIHKKLPEDKKYWEKYTYN